MFWFTGFVMFVMMWCIIFLAVLPFGSHKPSVTEEGHARSAPAKTYLARKVLLTTIVSIIVFGIAYWLIDLNILELDNMP